MGDEGQVDLYGDDGKVLLDEEGRVKIDGECCGGQEIVINAKENCMCGPNVVYAISVALTEGTWRLTYQSGAVTTNTGDRDGWNAYRVQNNCNSGWTNPPGLTWKVMVGLGATIAGCVWQTTPGSWKQYPDKYLTAAEAEAASAGDYEEYVIGSGGNTLWLFYIDDVCGDNNGSITFSLVEV
jgi:hypothetical protein